MFSPADIAALVMAAIAFVLPLLLLQFKISGQLGQLIKSVQQVTREHKQIKRRQLHHDRRLNALEQMPGVRSQASGVK